MSRYALWGVAAAAALAMAPAARAGDDKRADPNQTNETQGSASKMEHGKSPAASGSTMSSDTARQGDDVRTSSDKKASDKGISKHDNTDVIPRLYRANLMEVESAKVAQKNAESQAVKDFAKQMERDHGEMADSLKKLADDRKLKLDDDAAKKQHQAHLDQMKDMKGAQFDQHYTRMMVSEHEQDLNDVKAALQQARQSGDNDLVSVLEKAQTTMQGHHRMAMDLDRNKGSDTRQGRRATDTGSSATAPSSTGSTSTNSSEAHRSDTAGTTGSTDASGGTSKSSSSPDDKHGGSSSSSSTTTK